MRWSGEVQDEVERGGLGYERGRCGDARDSIEKGEKIAV
jgi:hypothetical protein